MPGDYHDYVFDTKARRLIGDFDAMYKAEDAGEFDSWQERDLRPLRKQIALDILEQQNFNSILEIGCGKGTLTHLLKKINNTIVATDIAPSAITKARASYPDIDFRVMSADAASRLPGPFDLTLVMGAFAYVERWKECLANFPASATHCLIAEYIPPNPIGFVKSGEELQAEFASYFALKTKVIIDDHFYLLFGMADQK